MNQPQCLHIPTLYEGEIAPIVWGATRDDDNYILERIFDDTFLQALSGQTWANIDSIHEPWSQYDQEALNWWQIEAKTGKGRSFEQLEYNHLNWQQIEGKSLNWQQMELLDMSFEIFRGSGTEYNRYERGCLWYEFDSLNKSWQVLEANSYSWNELELVTFPGLSWDSVEARWLNFAEWEQKGKTFQELETIKAVEKHRGMTDYIPIGAKKAMYRIKSYHANGEESDYLTTDQVPVIPIFYRSSEVNYPVTAGNSYYVLLAAEDISGLDRIRMNLRYHQHLLELVSMSAHSKENVLKAGIYQNEHLELYSHLDGVMWFQSTRPVKAGESYSGTIALAKFTAKGTGIAAVSLY